jgi:hypothetical protein
MSGLDRDTEASYANLVREVTGLPLVGMTLAGAKRRAPEPTTRIDSMVDGAPAEDYHQRYFEKHGVACHVPGLS